MAYNLKITVFNNRDYEQTFTLNDSDGAMNLTGCYLIFSMDVGGKLSSYMSNTPANPCITITDAITGQIKLNLPYTVLKKFEAGNYEHDLILVDADGKRSGVWTGQLIVKDGVTA